MLRGYWIVLSGLCLYAIANIIWKVVGRSRKRRIERLMLAQGAVKHEDGSITFSKGGFQFCRNLVPTGEYVGAGEVPIFCAINKVELGGIRPVLDTVRISRRKSILSSNPEKLRFETSVGSKRFVGELHPTSGYVVYVCDRRDTENAGRLVNAFRSVLDGGLEKSWTVGRSYGLIYRPLIPDAVCGSSRWTRWQPLTSEV